jgi:alkylhydroperoxidase family enzyme
VTDAIRDGRAVPDERLGALSSFTRHVLSTRGRPTRAAAEAFLAAGFSEPQILAVVLAIAVKTISNYSNHMFETPLDDVFAGRAWRA